MNQPHILAINMIVAISVQTINSGAYVLLMRACNQKLDTCVDSVAALKIWHIDSYPMQQRKRHHLSVVMKSLWTNKNGTTLSKSKRHLEKN